MIREATRSPLEIAEVLRPAILRLARNLRRETETLGVTSHQATLLAVISSMPGLSLRELAAAEGISAPSLSGHVDRLECEWFCFRSERTDSPIVLTAAQRAVTREIVERVLARERDLGHRTSAIRASAEAYSPQRRVRESTRVLARYLESGVGDERSAAKHRRAQ